MNAMRVLQINNFEQPGGGSERVYQLTTRLLLDQGHQVATLTCGTQSFDDRKRSVLLERNGYIQRNPLTTWRNIQAFIRRPEAEVAIDELVSTFRPDIAHLHIFYGQLSSAILSRLKVLEVPTVMTVHEYRLLCPVSTLFTPKLGVCERCAGGRPIHAVLHRCNRGSIAASVLSALESQVRDRAHNHIDKIDHFFMVSKFCMEKHAQYLPTIRDKSSVLYNFVDLPDTAGAPDAERTVLYAGRLSPEKGLDMLCQVVSRRSGTRLLVAGDGPVGPMLRQQYGSYANIQFLGKLSPEALAQQVRRAWCTVAPSEWYENNPMAVLESLAQGTPVIGARIGGIPEIVVDGQTGWLFTPSDSTDLERALDRALSTSYAERARLAQAGRAMVADHHCAQAYLRRLLAGYQQVISQYSNTGSACP